MGRYKNTGIGKGIGTSPQLSLENQEYENKVHDLEEKLQNEEKSNDKTISQTLCNNDDIKKLENAGVKFNKDDLIFVANDSSGHLIWLEQGNNSVGLNHIVVEHGKQFADAGIAIENIPQILIETIKNGEYVGIQGRDRKVYKINYQSGEDIYVAITISNNGFIVGANLTSKFKEKK